MIGLAATAAAEAFLQVGVWVGLTLACVAVVQHHTGGALLRRLTRSPASARVGGALLGMLPGCGGAIVIVPLYVRGTVPFGAVVAALVATMGDSSLVLLAADPAAAVGVHVLLLLTGLATGALVDLLGLDPRAHLPRAVSAPAPSPRSVGAAAATVSLFGRPALVVPSPGGLAFWALAVGGLALGAPVEFGLLDPADVPRLLGGVDTLLLVGLAGAALCSGAALASRGVHDPADPGSVWEALEGAARTTARVMTWVAIAYVAVALAVAAAAFDPARLSALGAGGVVAGAAIGLVPGCGAQVMVTALYGQGVLPFPTLLANALSQDGDALFPLLAADRRAALAVSALTLVPAVLVGGLAQLLA